MCTHTGLGSSGFARRYYQNHCCFLFLRLLRCFSSPGSLYMAMYSPYSDRSFSCRVSPFRNRRVNGYLLLTAAYRSLSRLSSALSAKASTLRSYSLDLLFQCISDNTSARFFRNEYLVLVIKNRFLTIGKIDFSQIFDIWCQFFSMCSFQGTFTNNSLLVMSWKDMLFPSYH